LMSESIWAIWKMRCDRVIKHDGAPYSIAEVHNRWVSLMNKKLSIDRALTNKVKFGKQFSVDPQLVLDTWRGFLHEENELPERWLGAPEVLVDVVP
ncbi:hypothetical protein C8R43DRAFT_867180, partial [Mycena crocata]